jgi:glycosyltransferase involved in cell wall biosynthesis
MRVLHLLNDIEDNGNGIVYSTMELALEQAASGLTVAVASSGGGFQRQLAESGVQHFEIPQRSGSAVAANTIRLRFCLLTFHPDIVHCHMVSGTLLAKAARVLVRGRGPLIIAHVRNSWMRHARLMRVADHAIALSEASRDYLLMVGFKAGRTSVVRNGSIGSRLRRETVADRGAEEPLSNPCVVSVCGLYSRKGIFDLVEAAKESMKICPNLKFFIVGEGDERKSLEQAIEQADLVGRFVLLGFRKNILPVLQQATVFVLASHDEPFGRVILEARASGAPIVATNVGGIPEATDGGRCALLVPPREPLALAAAICTLVQDENTRRSLIDKGRANLDEWSVERVAKEVQEVYQRELRKRGEQI